MSDSNYALRTLQELNRVLYGVSDDRKYSFSDIISYIHRHITQILKNVRKNDHQYTEYHLCSVFSWTLAYANRIHIDVVEEMWRCFPGGCPYCGGKPCTCSQRNEKRDSLSKIVESPGHYVSVSEWQELFAQIYPNNTLLNSAMHLAEEIGELSEASRNYRTYRDDIRLQKVLEEVVDIFANLFAVATCAKINMADALTCYFRRGLCPKCEQSPCGCSYVEFDTPIEM